MAVTAYNSQYSNQSFGKNLEGDFASSGIRLQQELMKHPH